MAPPQQQQRPDAAAPPAPPPPPAAAAPPPPPPPALLAAEELFADTESVVVAAFSALKVSRGGGAESTGAQLLKALGARVGATLAPSHPRSRGLLRPAVLVFTVRRSAADRGFVASVHVARPLLDDDEDGDGDDERHHHHHSKQRRQRHQKQQKQLELRKSYPLRVLADLRVAPAARVVVGSGASAVRLSDVLAQQQQQQQQGGGGGKAAGGRGAPGGGGDDEPHVVELRLSGGGGGGGGGSLPEHRGTYLLLPASGAPGPGGARDALLFASLAVQLLRQQDAVLPAVGGATMDRLDAFWAGHADDVAAALSAFARDVVVTPGAVAAVGRPRNDDGEAVLVSAREAGELEELLSLFELGLGESAEFAAALQQEAAAVEAANVFAMLGSGRQADGVLASLRRTQGLLDDLDEGLKVFDFKLRHMRDDIAAIEASNNALERSARHNEALLALLERLLRDLALDRSLAARLEAPSFEHNMLDGVVAAAWQLHARRLRLAPGDAPDALSPALLQMRVVREAAQALDQLAARFVARAMQHLLTLLAQLAADAAAAAGRGGERLRRVAPPGRRGLRDALGRRRALVQVLAALEPRALAQLQQQACAELNGLLRRELHAAVAELRRGVAADLSAAAARGEGDYRLLGRERHSSSSASARLGGGGGGGGGGARPSVDAGGGSDSGSEFGGAVDPGELGGGWGAPAPGGGASSASAARLAGFLDGALPAVPLHEAWAYALGGFVPFLASEAAFAADLLLLHRGDEDRLRSSFAALATAAGAEGDDGGGGGALEGEEPRQSSGGGGGGLRSQFQQQRQQRPGAPLANDRPPGCALSHEGARAVEALLAGLVGDELAGLAEPAARGHQVLLLPMLAAARSWHCRLQAQPAAQPLSAALVALCRRLEQAWAAFLGAQAAALDAAHDARGAGTKAVAAAVGLGQGGAKAVHVLPAVSQFCLLARDLERALAEGLAAVGAGGEDSDAPRASLPSSPAAAAGGDHNEGEGEDERAARAAARSVRAVADAAHDELAPRLLARVERAALADPKHAERVRLENYAYLSEALRGAAARLPGLRAHWGAAEARREAALRGYVAEQLAYSRLWRLLEFGDRLDALLKVVSPPEVAFQKDCSQADVRALMRTTMDGADKKLEQMAARARKHLGHGRLFDGVWAAIKDALLRRYEHLEWLLEQCYPATPLRPSPEELRELFRATSAG